MSNRTENMNHEIGALIALFKRALALKELPRTGAIMEGATRADADTIAAHSHAVSLLSYLTAKQLSMDFPAIDCERVVSMAVLHDLGECITGDLPTGLKRLLPEISDAVEERALDFLLSDIHGRDDLLTLIREYNACRTAESRIVKFADIVDAFVHLKTRLQREFPVFLEVSEEKLRHDSPASDGGVGVRLADWLRVIRSDWTTINPKPFPKRTAPKQLV